MLKLNLDRLVRMRSKLPTRTYLMSHGFTRHETRSLTNPKLTNVKLSVMTRLCNLFLCYPTELFCHPGVKESHLNDLNHAEPESEADLLEGLSPEDISEIRIADEKRKRR